MAPRPRWGWLRPCTLKAGARWSTTGVATGVHHCCRCQAVPVPTGQAVQVPRGQAAQMPRGQGQKLAFKSRCGLVRAYLPCTSPGGGGA